MSAKTTGAAAAFRAGQPTFKPYRTPSNVMRPWHWRPTAAKRKG